MKKRIIKYTKICGVIVLSTLLLIFPESAARSVSESIGICIGTIIPSMFAFMAISSYLICEGLHGVIFKPLYFIIGKIIRLDSETFGIFCLSMVGGYPVGINLLKEQFEQNDSCRKEIETAAGFCYCISPSFAVTMIGLGIYSSAEAGFLVYISNVLACCVMAAVFGRKKLSEKKGVPRSSFGIIGAVRSSALSLFTVCTVIVAFNVILSMLTELSGKIGLNLPEYILGFAEISNLLKLPPRLELLPLISGICSFGGICVLIQCAAICGKAFSLKLFLLMRIPTAVLSGLICFILLQLFEISIPASGGGVYAFTFDENGIVLITLMAMNVILFSKNEKNLQKG